MCSVDRGSAVAPLAEGVETVSPVIPAPEARSYEKCAACGTICGPNGSPQLLPCLHSVCKVCIPPVGVGESKRECPSCKRSYYDLEVTDNPLLTDSATGPGTHLLIKCAGCEDTAISSWCVECGEALCSICVSAHQRVRVTRDHTVLPQKLPTGFIPTLFCPTHRGEPRKLFCVSCSQLTCRDCQLTYHRNHSYQFLHEAVTAQREEIECLMTKVRLQRETVKHTLQDLDGRLQDLEEIKSRTKSKLQKILIYIRCALLKRTSELFKNVQDLCGREAQKIAERQNNLRTLEERQEYILSFTERVLQMENHSALLSCKRQVHSQLLDLLSQSATPPTSMIDVKLHFAQESCCQIATFGKLVSSEVPFSRKNHDSVPKKSSLPPVQRQNVYPAPSSYQPYSATVLTPSSSPSPLTSPQISPISVSPPPYSAPSVSAVTSCAPLAPVSHSSAASSPSSVHSSLSYTPPPPYPTCTPPASSPPGSLSPLLGSQSQPSRKRKNKLTWSFHPYQPKNYKPAGPQPNSCSPEPPPYPLHAVGPPASSLAAECQSPPVSTPSPTSILVLFPLAPGVPETSPEQCDGQSVQTAETGPAAVPQGPGPESPSAEPAELTVHVQPDREELQSRTLQCVLPVKAPADSPCERAPPDGCERPADPSPPATENEPTSTVAETEAALPVGPPQADGAGLPRTAGPSASRSAGDAHAGGTSGSSAARFQAARWSAGHKPALPAGARHSLWATVQPRSSSYPPFGCSLQRREEVRVHSGPRPRLTTTLTVRKFLPGVPFSVQYSSKLAEEPRFQPMKTPHEEGKPSNMRNANPESAVSQQAPPTRTQPIRIPVQQLEKSNAWLPYSLKEILEMPSPDPALAYLEAFDRNPLLLKLLVKTPSAEFEPTDQANYSGSPVETEKTDDDEDGQDSVDTGVKSESSGVDEESGRPVNRRWLPLVSLMRLPVTVPPSDQPLPQFRLLPGVNEDEILLQVIEDDDQSPGSQSAQAAERMSGPHRSDHTKAKLIVLRGPLANPTQPRKSHQRANHCSGQQPVSLDLTSRPEGPGLHRPRKAAQKRCAACRLSGGLTTCAQCERSFHRDCHIPPIGSTLSSGEWQCMLCRDLTDVEDLYGDESHRRCSLSLLDQKKCEHLLLTLMCRKYSSVLYRKVELSSHYVDITLIRGRLLRKLSPQYRTASEFVSDIWVLLETLVKNSEDSALVFKMQKYFQRKLRKTFGDALHPSLLKCPGMDDCETAQDAGDEMVKVKETLKRMRAYIATSRLGVAKKACRDEETEPRDQSPGPA